MTKNLPASTKEPTGQKNKEEAFAEAKRKFVTDPKFRPAEYWWDEVASESTALKSFLHRVNAEKWLLLRKEYQDKAYKDFIVEASYQVANERIGELSQLREIKEDLVALILPKIVDGEKQYTVPPRSLEGAIGALTKVLDMIESRRGSILSSIAPETKEGNIDSAMFDDETMKEVAQSILSKLRQGQVPEKAIEAIEAKDDA